MKQLPFFGIRSDGDSLMLEFNWDGIPNGDEYDQRLTQKAMRTLRKAGVADFQNTNDNVYEVLSHVDCPKIVKGFLDAGFVMSPELHNITAVPLPAAAEKVKVPSERHSGEPHVIHGLSRVNSLSSWGDILAWESGMKLLVDKGLVTPKDVKADLNKCQEIHMFVASSPWFKAIMSNSGAIAAAEGYAWVDVAARAVARQKLFMNYPLAMFGGDIREFARKAPLAMFEAEGEKAEAINVASPEKIGYYDNRNRIHTSPRISVPETFLKLHGGIYVPHENSAPHFAALAFVYDVGNGISPQDARRKLPIELRSPFGLCGEEVGKALDMDYPLDVMLLKNGATSIELSPRQWRTVKSGIALTRSEGLAGKVADSGGIHNSGNVRIL